MISLAQWTQISVIVHRQRQVQMPAIKITREPSLSGHGYPGSHNVYYVKSTVTVHPIRQPIIFTAGLCGFTLPYLFIAAIMFIRLEVVFVC